MLDGKVCKAITGTESTQREQFNSLLSTTLLSAPNIEIKETCSLETSKCSDIESESSSEDN